MPVWESTKEEVRCLIQDALLSGGLRFGVDDALHFGVVHVGGVHQDNAGVDGLFLHGAAVGQLQGGGDAVVAHVVLALHDGGHVKLAAADHGLDLGREVKADHGHVGAVGLGQAGDKADGGAVVGAEHALDVGVGGQVVLAEADGLADVAVVDLDVIAEDGPGFGGVGLPVLGKAVDAVGDGLAAGGADLDGHLGFLGLADAALLKAAQHLLGGGLAGLHVVGHQGGAVVVAVDQGVHQHDGRAGVIGLGDGRIQRDRVQRGDDDAVRLGGDRVLQQGQLALDVGFQRGADHDDIAAQVLAGLLGAGLQHAPVLVAQHLDDDVDGLFLAGSLGAVGSGVAAVGGGALAGGAVAGGRFGRGAAGAACQDAGRHQGRQTQRDKFLQFHFGVSSFG